MGTTINKMKDKNHDHIAVAGWLSWWEHHHVQQRGRVQFPVRAHNQIAGSIPGRGVYRKWPTALSLSKKSMNISLGEDKKNISALPLRKKKKN